ncbi:efflux RND transporter periplasmic adaptor subunit, partial [bacterium]|nr:efflux RND transporter periplasmic adaptor subunit [bacterium]
MKLHIRYILLLALLTAVGLFLTTTGCIDKDRDLTEVKTSQTIDQQGHEGHGHEAERNNKEAEQGHEGCDHDAEIQDNIEEEEGHEGHDHEAEVDGQKEEAVIHILPQALNEAGIVVESLKPRILSSTLELPGTVLPHPQGEGFVGSLVEGRIKEIFVDIGDRVSEGEPLCVIESPTVCEAEAAYVTALAELEFVRGDLERHKILVSEGIGAQKEQLELQ